jgi:hypothetical protein
MTTFFSNISNVYHTTTEHETLEPHLYIDTYKDPEIKRIMHVYKFTKDKHLPDFLDAKDILVRKTLDICIDRYMQNANSREKNCHIFTSPPSTMYERGEKDEDSMFELIRLAIRQVAEFLYISKNYTLHTSKVYTVFTSHLKKQRAQHIDGTRRARTENIKYRYSISLRHGFYLWYQIHVRKIKNFSYTIIDDVSSTGSTLVACKYTLLTYFEHIQKKHPHIKFDVQVCSLVH